MKPEELAALILVAGLGAVAWMSASVAFQLGVRPFGPQRFRAVPWTVYDVLFLTPLVIADLWKAALPPADAKTNPSLGAFQQFATIAALSLPIVLVVLRGARPYQMGLHSSHFGRNTLVGIGAYFLAAPLIAFTFLIALRFFERTPHEIEEILRKTPTRSNLILAFVGAVGIAPVLEELLFRGILLPWLRRVLGAWPAIVLSSVIFAAAHSDAWPAPIPLFILALFLGYLAYRTTSLVASITLHATFNAVSMLVLIVSVKLGI